jgi:hypothetical protein
MATSKFVRSVVPAMANDPPLRPDDLVRADFRPRKTRPVTLRSRPHRCSDLGPGTNTILSWDGASDPAWAPSGRSFA